MPKRSKPPKYSLHKATGQARVRIGGTDHYLGVFGSPESHAAYAKLVDAWLVHQSTKPTLRLTVGQLTVRYLEHAQRYYVKRGRPTGEVPMIKTALKRLNRVAKDAFADELSPQHMRAVQAQCIADGVCRNYVNHMTRRIRRMVKWAVGEEFVPATVLISLQAIGDLKRGRSAARETGPVRPVSIEHVNAVLPLLSRQVAAMVKLQLLSGCRPNEVVQMRPCDLDRTGEVWEFVPQSHKTEHHGKERRIYLGPKAQAVLLPFLDDRPGDAYCFSPAEAEAARRAAQRAARKTPVQPSQRNRKKAEPELQPGLQYDVCGYRRAIHRACQRAGIPKWSPNQLRHTRATDLRKAFGIEAAQVVCGHSSLDTTLVYAETSFERAKSIMLEVG